MDHKFWIVDVGVLPALLDDYGYYLIKRGVDKLVCRRIGAPLELVDRCSAPRTAPLELVDRCSAPRTAPLELVDKRLGVVSTIDFLHQDGGKRRIYIDALRLSQACPDDLTIGLLGAFVARMALATTTKCGYDEHIHGDYAIVGTERVWRASKKERRQDLRTLRRVRATLEGRFFLDATGSHGALYPNLKADYAGVFRLDEQEKKQCRIICEQVGDVSVVWQCGIKRRMRLREQGIYSWRDPNFQQAFYNLLSCPSRARVVRRMLALASDSNDDHRDLWFPPRDDVLARFPILRRPFSSWVFVDFETDFQKCIYLVGHYTSTNGYTAQWADHLDPGAEKPLMLQAHATLSAYKRQGRVLCYYFAEMSFWRERCRFHNMGQHADLFDDGVDLARLFVQAPFIIRGVFNFKLKAIASKLFELGYVGVRQPDGCADGEQSVDLAKQYFRTRDDGIASVLEAYNRFDCQVLCDIVRFLQDYFSSC